MTAAWIELEGAHNVRDMGGLATPIGPTRSGVLLRSDALDLLTDADVGRLVDKTGLAHVVDLRSGVERDVSGRGRLGATGVVYTELEVIGPEDLERRRATRAVAYSSGRQPAEIMADGYVELLELGATAFATALRRIVEPGGTPVLAHCSAGKDRTGVMIALLLDVVGVERALIVADYAVTNERMAPIVERLGAAASYERVAATAPAFVFEAVAETMERFLDQLAERWGGAADFFRANGVGDDAMTAWRERFVSPAADRSTG